MDSLFSTDEIVEMSDGIDDSLIDNTGNDSESEKVGSISDEGLDEIDALFSGEGNDKSKKGLDVREFVKKLLDDGYEGLISSNDTEESIMEKAVEAITKERELRSVGESLRYVALYENILNENSDDEEPVTNDLITFMANFASNESDKSINSAYIKEHYLDDDESLNKKGIALVMRMRQWVKDRDRELQKKKDDIESDIKNRPIKSREAVNATISKVKATLIDDIVKNGISGVKIGSVGADGIASLVLPVIDSFIKKGVDSDLFKFIASNPTSAIELLLMAEGGSVAKNVLEKINRDKSSFNTKKIVSEFSNTLIPSGRINKDSAPNSRGAGEINRKLFD